MSHVALGKKEKIRVSLFEDNIYNKAKGILLDSNDYYDIFDPMQSNVLDNISPKEK